MSSDPIDISYRFVCGAAETMSLEFHVRLDPLTLNRDRSSAKTPPEWAKLDNHICPRCPLASAEVEYCPAALSLSDLVEAFDTFASYSETRVTTTIDGKTISAQTDLQGALQSLFGLYLATSGCPVLDKFKPMARFHLPFATREETIFRAAGSYLLAQYRLKQQGRPHDFNLEGLRDLYAQVAEINGKMAERLKGLSKGDAILNAITFLDTFTWEIPFAVEDGLAEFDNLFQGYLRENDP